MERVKELKGITQELAVLADHVAMSSFLLARSQQNHHLLKDWMFEVCLYGLIGFHI